MENTVLKQMIADEKFPVTYYIFVELLYLNQFIDYTKVDDNIVNIFYIKRFN